jgi:hypothetical protein
LYMQWILKQSTIQYKIDFFMNLIVIQSKK